MTWLSDSQSDFFCSEIQKGEVKSFIRHLENSHTFEGEFKRIADKIYGPNPESLFLLGEVFYTAASRDVSSAEFGVAEKIFYLSATKMAHAKSYFVMGIVYFMKCQYDISNFYFSQALMHNLEDQELVKLTYFYIATNYVYMKDCVNAKENFRVAAILGHTRSQKNLYKMWLKC